MIDPLRRLLVAACCAGLACPGARAGAYEDYFRAVVNDDAGAVAQLLKRGFDVNTVDEKGQPAIVLAMREGAFKTTDVLLAQSQLDVDRPNAAGETALMMAALKGHVDWSRRLIDRGAKLEPGWLDPASLCRHRAGGPTGRSAARPCDGP